MNAPLIRDRLNAVAQSRRSELLLLAGMTYYMCTIKDRQLHAEVEEMKDFLRQRSRAW